MNLNVALSNCGVILIANFIIFDTVTCLRDITLKLNEETLPVVDRIE